MKPRTTLILVTLAFVVALIVVLDRYKGTTTEEAASKRKRLVNLDAREVTRFQLIRTNQTIALEKSGERWEIKQPLAVRANSTVVNGLLDDLEFAERDRTLSAAELTAANLADFGLEQPRLRVTWQGKKGGATLLIGRQTPTKEAVYVQVEGHKEVFIANKSLIERLDRALDDLRDRTVLDYNPTATTRLEIRNAGRVLELVKSAGATNAEPRWALSRPLAARADQEKVSGLLGALTELRASTFVSDDAKDVRAYGLDDPAREVSVWMGDTAKTLQIGPPLTNDASKTYAKVKGSDSIITIPSEDANKFALQVNDLRDRHVLTFADADVRGLDLLRGAEKIALVQTAGVWKITAPQTVDAEPDAIRQLLSKLGDLTVQHFAADVATDLDKFGLAAPALTITLLGEGTNTLSQLLIGGFSENGSARYVKRADEPFIYGVDPKSLDRLPSSYLDLRARRVANFQIEQVKKLSVTNNVGQVQLQRDADAKWRLVEPAHGALDNDGLQQLLGALANLRAEQFRADGQPLERPATIITAQVGDKNYVLNIGDAIGNGQRLASWNDPALTFTISDPTAQTLLKQVVSFPAPAAVTNSPAATTTKP